MKPFEFTNRLLALSSALGFLILAGAPSAQADTEADLFNRTFLTCPNGAQALLDIQAVGNELTQTQVESDLNPNSTPGAVVEQGVATILRNPGALNPAIGAPIRMTGCFAFKRTLGSKWGEATRCEYQVTKFSGAPVNPMQPCPLPGRTLCPPPMPCAAPPPGCNYVLPAPDSNGCVVGCGMLKC
jgi:hypothetical protein